LDNTAGVLRLVAGAVDLVGRLHVETTLDVAKIWEFRSSEVSREVNGTSDLAKLRERDSSKIGVVGNLSSTSDALKHGDGDVSEL